MVMDFGQRFTGWTRAQSLIYLNQPPPPNAPELSAPTRVKVLRPFYVGKRRLEIGEEVVLEKSVAVMLAGVKCELLP